MPGMSQPVNPLGEIQTLPIGQVKPAPNNPRKITGKAVEITARSIRRFGWQQPLVVDTNHELIVGHTRLQAAKSLGLKTVPVIVANNLTPAEVDAYRIADNRTGDYTTWDFPELVDQLEELSDDFSDELGLADWRGILNDFDEMVSEEGGDITDLALDEETSDVLDMKHSLTVVCRSEEDKLKVEAQLIEMEEVVDVRHKR